MSSSSDLETLIWSPYNKLDDKTVDTFLVLARYVHTKSKS